MIGYQLLGKAYMYLQICVSYKVGAKTHHSNAGLSSRIHQNSTKRPHNRTETDGVEAGKAFIEKFADNHALVDSQHTKTMKLCFCLPTCPRVLYMCISLLCKILRK